MVETNSVVDIAKYLCHIVPITSVIAEYQISDRYFLIRARRKILWPEYRLHSLFLLFAWCSLFITSFNHSTKWLRPFIDSKGKKGTQDLTKNRATESFAEQQPVQDALTLLADSIYRPITAKRASPFTFIAPVLTTLKPPDTLFRDGPYRSNTSPN